MAHWAFQTDQVPNKLMGAAIPIPGQQPQASSWGTVAVHGAPGTARIPSPRPAALIGGEMGAHSGDMTRPSSWAPDAIYPSIYYVDTNTSKQAKWGGTQTRGYPFSNNELPVPAIGTSTPLAPFSTMPTISPAVPTVAQRPARVGGRKVTAWPRVVPRWPVFGGGG